MSHFNLIEDEVGANETLVAEKNLQQQLKSSGEIDTYRDINTNLAGYSSKMDTEANIHLSNKYEDLVRQQMSSKLGDDGQEDSATKSPNGSGRHTPLGDVALEPFQDGDSTYLKTVESDHSRHSSARQTPQMDNFNSSFVEDDVEQRTYVQSLSATYQGSPIQAPLSDTVEDFFTVDARRSPVRSDHSAHSSARQTPTADRSGSEGRRTPQRSGDPSYQGFSRHTPMSDIVGDLGSVDIHKSPVGSADHSVHSSARQTPQYDVLESNIDRTPVRSADNSVHSSARHTPQVELIDDILGMSDRQSSPVRSDHSAHSSIRQTPQKELITDTFRSSQEKLYGSQEMLRYSGSDRDVAGSYHGSGEGSKSASLHGSRPQSVTSEQELTQYFEAPRPGTDQGSERSDSRRTPVMGVTSLPPTYQGFSGSERRTGSASSLPVLSTQPRIQGERRSHTPDNHIRVPASSSPMLRGPLVTGRGAPLSAGSSRASSRTVTPVASNGIAENGHREDAQRVQELEDSITNLRKLLSNRESEVHELTNQIRDLRDINRSLREEMDHIRARTSPGLGLRENSEEKYNQLLSEKEILAGEVVKLQDELEEIRKGKEMGDSGKEDRPPSLSSYSPNNPYALQRKIADLQSQIQDVQEANESHVAELSNAEKKIQELTLENKSLFTVRSGNERDLQDENKRLHEQISRLREQGTAGYGDGDLRSRVESQQIREDNRALRERNYVLHDDNIKLKEELGELRRVLEYNTQKKTDYLDDKSRICTPEKGDRERLHDTSGYPLSDTGYRSDKAYRSDSLYHTDPSYNRVDRVGVDTRTSLEKTDRARLERDSVRHIPTRTNYERYERVPKLESTALNRSLDRSFEKPRYDALDLHHTQTESLRTVPDGSAGDKSIHLNSSLTRYESLTLPERSSLSKAGKERSRSERLGLDRDLTSDYNTELGRQSLERDYKSFTSSYPASSYPELSRVSHISRADKPRDDPSPRRPGSVLSDRSDSTAALISAAYSRPSPVTSPQRSKQDYYTRESDKGFESVRKMPSAPAYTSEDPGDTSDTATDILVNAQPLDKASRPMRTTFRQRTTSVGSDASVSSFSDIDDELSASMRRRSKSADGRVLRRTPTGSPARSNPSTPVKGNPGGDRSLTPVSTGFRSMTPRPLATQHNKNLLSASSISLTQGMRPFAPRTPADVSPEDVVKFSRLGGKLSQGTVKFVGHLPGRSDIYLGVELDKEEGKHDGNFEGVRYFKCKPNKGVFVAFNKVVMAWAPY